MWWSPRRETDGLHLGRSQQDRFRPVIHAFPSLIKTAHKMVSTRVHVFPASFSPWLNRIGCVNQVKAAGILGLPVVVTEQNPKGNSVWRRHHRERATH